MHESDKINEAEHFFSLMLKTEDTVQFKFYLSAFLSAARSALQFALKEAKTKAGGQMWFDTQISGNQVVSFFKDKRDINIHEQPIGVSKDVSIEIQETLHLSDSISIVVRDAQGNIKDTYQSPEPQQSEPQHIPPITSTSFRFGDWTGNEDIPTLCRTYLDQVTSIIHIGQVSGYLTK